MSIKASLSSDGDGVEVLLKPPTLMELCLYKCLTNKEILTTEVEVDEDMDGNEDLDWEKFRLKKPILGNLVNALLDAGGKLFFMMTPKLMPVIAAIRLSQPEDFVKVNVSNTDKLRDSELEWLISGGNVKSLDIHGCVLLGRGSLVAINKFGSKMEYLRVGDSSSILPPPAGFNENESFGILKTPKLKTFIVSEIKCESPLRLRNYWKSLLKDFVSNLEDLQISSSDLETLDFLEPAKNKLSSLTLSNCVVTTKNLDAWAILFKLNNLRSLDLIDSSIGEVFTDNGENVVERLLAALPFLTQLNIDPGVVRNLETFDFVKCETSKRERLEFLGTMADVDEMEKGMLLANQVAGFGSTAGELRALEYYADRLNSDYFNSSLGKLLARFTDEGKTSAAGVGVLFINALKNNGNRMMDPSKCFKMLHDVLTLDVAVKLGDVVFNQFVEFVEVFLRSFPRVPPRHQRLHLGFEVVHCTIEMLLKLDCELRFDHYEALVATLMSFTEIGMGDLYQFNRLHPTDLEAWTVLEECIVKIAQFFKRTGERFPKLFERRSNIESILVIISEFKELISSDKPFRYGDNLRDSLRTMLSSLRSLCFQSGLCRAAFHAANGVKRVMDLMSDFLENQILNFTECDFYTMLEIIKFVLEDTTLTEFSETIPSELEKYLLLLNSMGERWEWWEPPQNTFYNILQINVGLLSYLEADPRFDYEGPAASAKKIIAKLK